MARKSGRCSNGACVHAEVSADGVSVTLTSTVEGNDGSVTYTRDEWDAFINGVQIGDWDATLTDWSLIRLKSEIVSA